MAQPNEPHQQSSAVIAQEPKAEHRKPKAGRTLCRIDRKLKRPFLAGLGLGPGPPKADRCDRLGSISRDLFVGFHVLRAGSR